MIHVIPTTLHTLVAPTSRDPSDARVTHIHRLLASTTTLARRVMMKRMLVNTSRKLLNLVGTCLELIVVTMDLVLVGTFLEVLKKG